MVVSLKLPLDGVFDLNPAVWFIRVLMINRGSRMYESYRINEGPDPKQISHPVFFLK